MMSVFTPCRFQLRKEVHTATRIDAFKQAINQLIISPNGNTLIGIIEIVVVERITYGQPANDKRWQLRAGAPPLLFRIAFDKCLVDIAPHQTDGLLLQIRYWPYRLSLTLNLRLRLFWCPDAPHSIERVHVEWQVIESSLVVSHRHQREAVELHETIHELPHLLIGSMKDMRPIQVHVDTLHVLAIHIATQMGALIYHQAPLPTISSKAGKRGSKEAGANYEVVVFHR